MNYIVLHTVIMAGHQENNMNALTKRSTQNIDRENTIIAWSCGIVLASLAIAFFI